MRVVLLTLVLACAPAAAQDKIQQLGQVIHVTGCNVGKRSLTCFVVTSTHELTTDVTNWPGNIIQKGDRLAIMERTVGKERTSFNCRNGPCRETTVCYNWMPCWRKP